MTLDMSIATSDEGNNGLALASLPRSGHTWVRVVVEKYLGHSTRSVYRDRIMPRPNEGVVIKTHRLDHAR